MANTTIFKSIPFDQRMTEITGGSLNVSVDLSSIPGSAVLYDARLYLNLLSEEQLTVSLTLNGTTIVSGLTVSEPEVVVELSQQQMNDLQAMVGSAATGRLDISPSDAVLQQMWLWLAYPDVAPGEAGTVSVDVTRLDRIRLSRCRYRGVKFSEPFTLFVDAMNYQMRELSKIAGYKIEVPSLPLSNDLDFLFQTMDKELIRRLSES